MRSGDEPSLDELLRALAHGERRLFVASCIDEPRAAGDLAQLSHLSLASVSEHLKVLRKVGLLRLETRGRFWFYRTDCSVLETAAAALVKLKEGPDGT